MHSTLIPQPRLFKAVAARVNPQVEWVEVQVKSTLNRVQGMDFDWSINPYRGCEHACPFCMDPDTPILMADCSHKPLSSVQVGDWIYGTEGQGFYRHYKSTQVIAKWETRKPVFRIVLEDGTYLLASGDHRFLTERGWKFITGAEQGPMQRPFLTVNNKLMGTGTFAQAPQKNVHYRRGYLTGLIRGDGLLATDRYSRSGRRHGNIYQLRLALTDSEALNRASSYLKEFDIPTFTAPFREADPRGRAMTAIRTSSRAMVAAVAAIVGWPQNPPVDWYKGFLAGIFDAEGGCNRGILRISNTDESIMDEVRRGLSLFGFDHVTERQLRVQQKTIGVVRLRGGLQSRLRFFHSVDPAIRRKCDIEGTAIKTQARLRVVAVEALEGELPLIDITTGTGDFIANGVVSHNCFARKTHWYLDQDGVGGQWSSRIFVKVNAPEVLRSELSRPTWKREEVIVGTATDPYQPAEGAYKITRRVLEALRDYRTPTGLITRSTMIVRDLDVLGQLSRGPGVHVCFSITTLDDTLSRELEPGTPPPRRRLEAMHTLSKAGITTIVLLAPILPGITDDVGHLTEIIEAAKVYGAESLHAIPLHLGDVTRDAFFNYLRHSRSELVPEYDRLYQGKYAPAQYRRKVQQVVTAIKRRVGFASSDRARAADAERPAPKGPLQLQLFRGEAHGTR